MLMARSAVGSADRSGRQEGIEATASPDCCDLVASIGSQLMGQAVLRFANSICNVDQCTAFAFRATAAPSTVATAALSQHEAARIRQLAAEYSAGAFHDDPNVLRALGSNRGGVGSFSYVLCPQELQNGEFRRRFYDAPQIRQEFAIWTFTKPVALYLSFYRTGGASALGLSEVSALQQQARLVSTVLLKHLEVTERLATDRSAEIRTDSCRHPRSREELLARIREALSYSSRELTPREVDICSRIVVGYTTCGIAHSLGITLNTVATHRKRAYYKLGISCQNELFTRFVDYLTHAPPSGSLPSVPLVAHALP